MAQASINGATIHYQAHGKGPAILLLHGFPLDSRMWNAQAEALSDAYRVVRMDLRGFGQSTSPGAFSIEMLADDVSALTRKLDLCPLVLGGLSMGGYVALAFARKYPMDLAGLVLVDTKAAGDSAEVKESRERMAELARTRGAMAVAEQMEPTLLAPGTRGRKPHVHETLRTMMESCPPETIAQACLAMRDRRDMQDELPSIPCPTLIICGNQDVITPPEVARQMQQAIPRSHLEIIPGAGHLTPIEEPAAVTTALRQFLEKVYAS